MAIYFDTRTQAPRGTKDLQGVLCTLTVYRELERPYRDISESEFPPLTLSRLKEEIEFDPQKGITVTFEEGIQTFKPVLFCFENKQTRVIRAVRIYPENIPQEFHKITYLLSHKPPLTKHFSFTSDNNSFNARTVTLSTQDPVITKIYTDPFLLQKGTVECVAVSILQAEEIEEITSLTPLLEEHKARQAAGGGSPKPCCGCAIL